MKAYFSDLPASLQEELGKFRQFGDYGPSKFYPTGGTGGKIFASASASSP